ncbi:MAG: uracil-DNA glycosylase family protein [Gammaproteobacteria bacterium]
MPDFDPGYINEPFHTLAGNFPGEDAYPQADFRTEWGPIFHRGRLDGSARLLIIGQDPGQHENVLRRILVGEAGRRVQGLMEKLGILHSYVMLNALLYSVYGSNGMKYVAKTKVAAYRNQWIEAILASGSVEAVITCGSMAKKAWNEWKKTPAGAASTIPVAHLAHPTQPESAGGTKAERAANTKTRCCVYLSMASCARLARPMRSVTSTVMLEVSVPIVSPHWIAC